MEKFAIEAAARECLAEKNLEIETFHHASFEANLGPAEDITKWYREISVRSQGLLDSQIPEKLHVVESELIKRFKNFEKNGSVHLPFPYRIVSAVK